MLKLTAQCPSRRVLNALIAVHKAGVAHGDVIQDNIVLKDDGTPMLIDFDCGEVHECTFIENSIKFHAPMPEAGDLGCYEIWQAAQEADVWPSCALHFLPRLFQLNSAHCAYAPSPLSILFRFGK